MLVQLHSYVFICLFLKTKCCTVAKPEGLDLSSQILDDDLQSNTSSEEHQKNMNFKEHSDFSCLDKWQEFSDQLGREGRKSHAAENSSIRAMLRFLRQRRMLSQGMQFTHTVKTCAMTAKPQKYTGLVHVNTEFQTIRCKGCEAQPHLRPPPEKLETHSKIPSSLACSQNRTRTHASGANLIYARNDTKPICSESLCKRISLCRVLRSEVLTRQYCYVTQGRSFNNGMPTPNPSAVPNF